MPKDLNLTNSDKTPHEVDFKTWNKLDELAKQIAYNEIKHRFASKDASIYIKAKVPVNGKLIEPTAEVNTYGLISLANTTGQAALSKPDSKFKEAIQSVYNRAQKLVLDDYIKNNVK
jgi:hypothetical protein